MLGGGSIGGLSCPLRRFSTSISVTRRLGETAETGHQPDSAPHVPLNTSVSSAALMILLKLVSGVPTMSTPRTISSGVPSA